MSQKNDIDEIISSEVNGYGASLRTEREKKGLSISNIATELHLEEAIVRGLESENKDVLPEAAYVCGYIRNYAKFLVLDPEPLIASFKKTTSINSVLYSSNKISYNLEKKQDRKTLFFISFLLLILLVGAFSGWQLWKNSKDDDSSTNNTSTLDSQASEYNAEIENNSISLPEISSSFGTIEEDTSAVLTDESQETTTDDSNLSSEQVAVINTEETEGNVTNINSESEVRMSVMDSSNTSASASLSQSTEDENLQPAQKQSTTTHSQKQLRFKFLKNSWISVKDANNKSLLYDLKRKGDTINLSAKSPVSIFLGDGTGVGLEVNDVKYDFSQYINSKKIAKFKVD